MNDDLLSVLVSFVNNGKRSDEGRALLLARLLETAQRSCPLCGAAPCKTTPKGRVVYCYCPHGHPSWKLANHQP